MNTYISVYSEMEYRRQKTKTQDRRKSDTEHSHLLLTKRWPTEVNKFKNRSIYNENLVCDTISSLDSVNTIVASSCLRRKE